MTKEKDTLTSAFGIPVAEDQNSLTAGPRYWCKTRTCWKSWPTLTGRGGLGLKSAAVPSFLPRAWLWLQLYRLHLPSWRSAGIYPDL